MKSSNLAVDSDRIGQSPQRCLKILILDDDEFDRRQVQRLSSQMAFPTEIDEATDLDTLLDRLNSCAYDAILIDYRLSNGTGLDALDIIASHNQNSSAAQIMIAGEPTFELAVKAMKLGCDEFLAKDTLDVMAIQKGIIGAILNSTKKASGTLNREIQELADAIANGVTKVCLTSIRPMISALRHKTHTLQENGASLSEQSKSAVTSIEQSCGILSNFLDGIETTASNNHNDRSKVVPLVK